MKNIILTAMIVLVLYVLGVFMVPAISDVVASKIGLEGFNQFVRDSKQKIDDLVTKAPEIKENVINTSGEFYDEALKTKKSVEQTIEETKVKVDNVRVKIDETQNSIDNTVNTIGELQDSVKELFPNASTGSSN